jgi:cobalt-zinc-cadmium efflux system outer membrane protein
MRHFLFTLLYALPLLAGAQPLTEADAVRQVLARGDLAGLEQGTIEAARADAEAAGLMPNPALGYSREHVPGATGSTYETWQLTQTFDFSGRRGLRERAAERRVDSAGLANTLRRAELAAETRRRFYGVLHRQKVVQATAARAKQFARIESVVGKLALAGEASGYDKRRLARERQAAESRLAAAQAELDRETERLASLLGKTGAFDVSGDLLPGVLPPVETSLAALDNRPALQMLSQRAEAAELEGRAAARGWVPDVTLGVGPSRTTSGGASVNGTVLTLSVPLPVFDRQQASGSRASAEALNARSEYGLARSRAEGELRGIYRQAERLRAAASEYRSQAAADSPELQRIAEAAYQGGESSLLELLDAYRGALEVEIHALDLEWKARETRIEYDLLTGSFPNE